MLGRSQKAKATDFDSVMWRFKSARPSQTCALGLIGHDAFEVTVQIRQRATKHHCAEIRMFIFRLLSKKEKNELQEKVLCDRRSANRAQITDVGHIGLFLYI